MAGGDDALEWKIGPFVVLRKISHCWLIAAVFKFLKNIYKGDLKKKTNLYFTCNLMTLVCIDFKLFMLSQIIRNIKI